MALKPTIYKASISLSDIDSHYYDELLLTIAQHPSETLERMMVRLLAFCLNAHECDDHKELSFTRGLSNSEEPDLWLRTLDDQIEHWIEIGQPEVERVKKGVNQSRGASVYCFGKSSDTWWQLNQASFAALPKTRVLQLPWGQVQAASQLLGRTMTLTVSITENTIYLANDNANVEIPVLTLMEPDL